MINVAMMLFFFLINRAAVPAALAAAVRISRTFFWRCIVVTFSVADAAAVVRRAQRGADLRYDIEMTLEEAVRGKEMEIRIHAL